uniref:Uncharacterized protein AlNc14C40G3442 n=1 Tax=Albugo laibachii Nc14 TaxID=890382 RepID=F0W9I3_9STRA|nr:conserved hypothetical protein [Albugo laibachii Nc14]|eukprot:CCA17797.1 conserved hypothetical protein [Albugo laibachii Nc14]
MAGTRLEIVASFIAFALVLAPFAWNIIQVDRVEITHDRIESLYRRWIDSNSTQNMTQSIVIVYSNEAHLQSDTNARTSMTAHNNNKIQWLFQKGTKEFDKEPIPREAIHQHHEEIARSAPINSFHVFFLCAEKSTDLSLYVGTGRYAWTDSCSMQENGALLQAVNRLVLEHVQFDAVVDVKSTHRARRSDRYRIDFTLLKQDGTDTWQWVLEELITQHLDPVLSKMTALADFTIEQHVFHFANIMRDVTPRFDGRYHVIDSDDLKKFKTANDYLATSVLDDREIKLHFMAALPAQKYSPMVIQPKKDSSEPYATSFQIPAWGGVIILNRDALLNKSAHDKAIETQRMIGLFVTFLRQLMGLPHFQHRQLKENESSNPVTLRFLPAKRTGVCDWELDRVVYQLFLRHMHAAITTLRSIATLISDMPQMSVPQRVQTRLLQSITLLEAILKQPLQENLKTDLAHARKAAALADAAYFDSSMIRQLYFPQEHMLGVFAPLLAPMILPLLLGFVREWKRYKLKKRTKLIKSKSA